MGVYSFWSVGFINAAQPAFFGLGAYTVAILMIRVAFALLAGISYGRNHSGPGSGAVWLRRLEDERRLFFISYHRFE